VRPRVLPAACAAAWLTLRPLTNAMIRTWLDVFATGTIGAGGAPADSPRAVDAAFPMVLRRRGVTTVDALASARRCAAAARGGHGTRDARSPRVLVMAGAELLGACGESTAVSWLCGGRESGLDCRSSSVRPPLRHIIRLSDTAGDCAGKFYGAQLEANRRRCAPGPAHSRILHYD
jgi:hypothetical protein